jgi:hypothetical protein
MDDDSKRQTLYEQVCRQHDEIQHFRAKLLSLLPIASAGGIFFLVKDGGIWQNLYPHLLAIGLFGIAVTAGLFEYELHGIRKCAALLCAARRLEEALSKECQGAFQSKPRRVEMKTAAFIIYPTTGGAWAYVATLGLPSLSECVLPPLISIASAVAIAFVFGFVEWKRLKHDLDKDKREAKCKEKGSALDPDGLQG